MSSSVRGRGGSLTMYLKHCKIRGINHSANQIPKWSTYLQTLAKFLLLLVNDTQAEVDFVGLLKFRRHTHHLRESFFGMVQGTIAIVEDTNTIP